MTPWLRRARERLADALAAQRLAASRGDALPQLAVLAVAVGVLTALVMIGFRTIIEAAQRALLPAGPLLENFAALSPGMRFALPVAGALAVGLLFTAVPAAARQVGIVHVMERLAYHQGVLPLRNALMQCVGASASIAAGLSVGREGPAVHLGATAASLLGQRLGLTHEGLRVLVGCGVASAIAASFNTPLAGVAFAMEVVLIEYTVVAFAPVILAAVCATGVTRAVYGTEPAFAVPQAALQSLWELPYVTAIGLAIGVLAAAFIALSRLIALRTAGWPMLARMATAGVLTGACAVAVPEVMGIGYATVSSALLGQAPMLALLTIAIAKLVASAGAVGLGVPAGLIGPMLVIGAAAGGALGMLGAALAPIAVSHAGYYALVGLGAMMAGTLHAPLAALTAMLELTGNPDIVLPGMLATIAAYGVSRIAFRQQPIFVMLMQARGLDYRNDPVTRSLRRVSAASAADDRVAVLPRSVRRVEAATRLTQGPNWVVMDDPGSVRALLPAIDLALQLSEHPDAERFDLAEIPARRLQLATIAADATVQQALDTMKATGAQAVCLERPSHDGGPAHLAVLTHAQIALGDRYAI